jgi:N4-gp56 family major capsid protein
MIDRARTKGKVLSPVIRPVKIMGEDKYVMFIHPFQHHQLRTNTATAQYMDIQKAAIQGGQISKNPIYTGSIAEYNNVILHESTRVPGGAGGATDGQSVSSGGTTSVYRSIFSGAQAGCCAVGRDTDTGMSASWFEELFDYGNQLGVAGGLIYGIKKSVFNSKDFSTIVVSTFSPDPG